MLKKIKLNRQITKRNLYPIFIAGGIFGVAMLFPVAVTAGLPIEPEELPATFQGDFPDTDPIDGLTEWWRSFADENLNTIEEMAVRNNYNAKAALKRIEASRQMLKSAYSAYYPTIQLQAGYDIERDSGRETSPMGQTSTLSYFQMGANMSWEIDVFGRVTQKVKSSKINVNLSKLEYDAFMLSLTSEVAQYYGALCMYHQQLKVAEDNLTSQKEMLKLVQDRYEAGLVSKLDIAQAENTVNNTSLKIPTLKAQRSAMKNALATLCGVSPEEIVSLLQECSQPALKIPASVGKPADLLRRRPDIAEAEQQIALTASELGIAKKDYLPSLSINASIGTSSHNINKLFGDHSLSYQVAPTLTWTLFEGFARKANVAEKRAQMEAQIDDYNNSVMTALQEVNNSIINYNCSREELALYDTVLATSRDMVMLSVDRYKLGIVDFSDVASAQVTYLNYQMSLLTSRNNCFNNLVALYKALGGGWDEAESLK